MACDACKLYDNNVDAIWNNISDYNKIKDNSKKEKREWVRGRLNNVESIFIEFGNASLDDGGMKESVLDETNGNWLYFLSKNEYFDIIKNLAQVVNKSQNAQVLSEIEDEYKL